MSKTAIEWTDVTWNPVRGCSRVSEGCRNCYAEQQAARIVRMGKGKPTAYDGLVRLVNGEARWTGEVRLVMDRLMDPLGWRKPRRVFVNSMSDLFHDKLEDWHIDRVVAVMMICCLHETRGGHTFQTLTKRSRRLRSYFCDPKTQGRVAVAAGQMMEDGDNWHDVIAFREEGLCHPKLWWGVSVEDQEAFNERWPDLEATPAVVRFLSAEPLLGPVNALTAILSQNLAWIIAGCESGAGARPCNKRWLRYLRDQCEHTDTKYFLKQAADEGDDKLGCDSDGKAQGITCGFGSHRKPGPGNIIGAPYLDGVQHLEFPK